MSEEAIGQGNQSGFESNSNSSGKKVSRRRFIRLAAATAALIPASSALLAACGDSTATPATTNTAASSGATAIDTTAAGSTTAAAATTAAGAATAASGGVPTGKLSIAVRAMTQTMDPVVSANEFMYNPQNYPFLTMFDTLTRVEGQKLIPGLAVSWKQIDPLNWEFKLRTGVKFHNGEEFTSASPKFTFETHFAQKSLYSILNTVASYAAPDPETFTVKTKIPDSLFAIKMVRVPLIPAKYYAEKGAAGFNTAPVGTGPFQFGSFERDKQIILKAWTGSWRGVPKLSEVAFQFLPDMASQVQALKAGGVDLVNLAYKDHYDSLKAAGFKTYTTLVGQTTTISFKTIGDNGPQLDKRVREALNLAINKPEMVKSLYGDLTQPASQVAPPVTAGYDASIPVSPYDLEKAKALFKEAGIQDGSLKFSIDFSAGSVGRVEAIEALSQYWGKLGVGVQSNPTDIVQFVAKGLKNELSPILLVANYTGPYLDALFGTIGFGIIPGISSPAQRTSNDEASKLLTQALAEPDTTKRLELSKQVEKIAQRETLYIPLYYGWDMFASSTKVNGFEASPNQNLWLENLSKS